MFGHNVERETDRVDHPTIADGLQELAAVIGAGA
jgi:hypothetical protein